MEAAKTAHVGYTRLTKTLKDGLKTKPRKFIWKYK